jgi:hypothetical protein
MIILKIFIQDTLLLTDHSMREQRITKKVNHTKPTTKILTIATILIISLVTSNISTVKEIKAQPIIPSLQSGKSQQITKTPASTNNQLPQQKIQHPSVTPMIHL